MKIKKILELGNYSQDDLARIVGVSTVTMNRWVNGKAVPYRKNIDELQSVFTQLTGDGSLSEDVLQRKNKKILALQNSLPDVVSYIFKKQDLIDQLALILTYNSNSLEGGTLSIGDTSEIILNDRVISNKPLREHLEAKNHQVAWAFLLNHLNSKKAVDEPFCLRLHEIMMNGIIDNAGEYRRHNVRIVGTYVPTTNFLSISKKMKEIFQRGANATTIKEFAILHGDFEKIHPFTDGNGRIGRLLLNAWLLQANLAPALIQQEKRAIYLKFLQKYQLDSDSTLLESLLSDSILLGYDLIYDVVDSTRVNILWDKDVIEYIKKQSS